MTTASRRRMLGTLGAWLALPARGLAQAAFPAHAVRLVVPYSVGVGPDVVARGLAEGLAARWGQPVVVDNKPGASGIVAFGDVRRVPADGHTLYLADTATLAVNPLLHASLPYDPQTDLAPLTLLFRATFVLWVGGASRWRTLAQLLEAARQAPGRVSYATLGHGHASHMAVESFARAADVVMLHVPFKDAGAMLGAVVAGEVDFTTISVNTAAGLQASGRLRALAVAARQRLAEQPDIPTLAQAGGPAVTMHPWAALVAPAGTPGALQQRLQHDIVETLAAAELRARAQRAGFELIPSTAAAVLEQVRADTAVYAPLVAEGRVARL